MGIVAKGGAKLEKLMDGRLQKWADRRRFEREGDEIMEPLERHEEKEKKLEEEKQVKDKWEKWEDRQRLEREGYEIVEAVRRHERKGGAKMQRVEEEVAEIVEVGVEFMRRHEREGGEKGTKGRERRQGKVKWRRKN